MKQMEGQYSIFDISSSQKPCEYRIKRFIGQRCQLRNGIKGKVVGIEKYYTNILGDDGEEYAGTPTDWYEEKI